MPLTRRGFLSGAAGFCAASRIGLSAPKKPNILIIVADDLGYGELGCQGNKQIPTPNIDSLAQNGVRFSNGYVSAPVCSPSRAGLMTGRYATRFGHEFNPIGLKNKEPGIGLPLSEETIANRMKSAGYATGLVGKWHLGGTPEFNPIKRGFDEFFGFLHEGHFYVPPSVKDIASHLRDPEPAYDEQNPILRGTEIVPEKEYLTEAFTREGVSFIDRHYKQPFLLVVTFNAIHSPMQAKPEYMKRFDYIDDQHRRVFAAMLASLDDGVGALVGKLRERKIEQDTMVCFVSDNGGPTAELTSSNAPLRGGKGQLWEGGIRTPSMVQWKGHLPAGKVYENPVSSLDFFATASALAGARGRAVDGVDLLPFLNGRNAGTPHDLLFWRYGRAIAVRKGNWKLVRQPPANEFQLFDLSRDIAETTNLAAQKPELARELEAALKQMDAQMVAPLWGGRARKK